MPGYIVLALILGFLAPWFLRSLRPAEGLFIATSMPLVARLTLGGLVAGALAIQVPEVCGNGYSVVVNILNGRVLWTTLIVIAACKWLAAVSSFGSGAPGGVFAPSLFMGASASFLFGSVLHAVWSGGAGDPRAFALVGMGAFLSAGSHAPVMAIIMLFEMTLGSDIILPLMLSSVIAYYTARGFEGRSLYSEALSKKQGETPGGSAFSVGQVAESMKGKPPTLARGGELCGDCPDVLSMRVNNLCVTDVEGRFLGAVALHDIESYLGEIELAELVIASDILREEFPRVAPDTTLSDVLGRFLKVEAERLPVVNAAGGFS